MKAYLYDEKKHFESEIECQIDPLESKKQGKDIYLLPADSTLKKPLEKKDGFDVIFDGTDWIYIELPKPDEHEITPEEIIKQQIETLKINLFEADYWGQKYIDGEYTDEEWEQKKAQRKAWRVEIRELEAQLETVGENSDSDGG